MNSPAFILPYFFISEGQIYQKKSEYQLILYPEF